MSRIGHLSAKIVCLSKLEKSVFTGNDRSILERADKFANYMGRRVVIGRISGVIRFGAGAVYAALCAIGSLFSLLLSGVTRPFNRSVSDSFYNFAGIGGILTVGGLLQTGRGLVEAIPVVGYWSFVNSDYSRYCN